VRWQHSAVFLRWENLVGVLLSLNLHLKDIASSDSKLSTLSRNSDEIEILINAVEKSSSKNLRYPGQEPEREEVNATDLLSLWLTKENHLQIESPKLFGKIPGASRWPKKKFVVRLEFL